jgi:hypothetical protein
MATIEEKILGLEEFSRHTFAPQPRLYSYKEARHLDLTALLLDPLNAPVLIITAASKKHRVLFKDYPSLKYMIALDTKPQKVVTRGKAFPLDFFFAQPSAAGGSPGGKDKKAAGQQYRPESGRPQAAAHDPRSLQSAHTPESLTALRAVQLFGALAVAIALVLLILFLIR